MQAIRVKQRFARTAYARRVRRLRRELRDWRDHYDFIEAGTDVGFAALIANDRHRQLDQVLELLDEVADRLEKIQ